MAVEMKNNTVAIKVVQQPILALSSTIYQSVGESKQERDSVVKGKYIILY